MYHMTSTTTDSTPRALTLSDLQAEGTTVSVERAGEYVGVSRTYAYQMARKGLLPTIKLGSRRVRVPTAALARMLSGESWEPQSAASGSASA